MGLSNFVVTVVGVGALAMLMKTDVRSSASMLRRNLKHIRTWLEETSASASASESGAARKSIEESTKSQVHKTKKPTSE